MTTSLMKEFSFLTLACVHGAYLEVASPALEMPGLCPKRPSLVSHCPRDRKQEGRAQLCKSFNLERLSPDCQQKYSPAFSLQQMSLVLRCQSANYQFSLGFLRLLLARLLTDKSTFLAQKWVNDFLIIWKCSTWDIQQLLTVKQSPFQMYLKLNKLLQAILAMSRFQEGVLFYWRPSAFRGLNCL